MSDAKTRVMSVCKKLDDNCNTVSKYSRNTDLM